MLSQGSVCGTLNILMRCPASHCQHKHTKLVHVLALLQYKDKRQTARMFDNTLIEIKCRGLDIRRQIFEAINILQPAASEDALMCKQEVVLDRSTKILTACLHKPFFFFARRTYRGWGGGRGSQGANCTYKWGPTGISG